MTTENLVKAIDIDWDNYIKMTDKEKRERNIMVAELEEKWKEWLFEDEGVSNNPKKDLCFEIAWKNGHSSGYYEVENEFRELVELIK